MSEDLILVPEVRARQLLRDRDLRVQILAPYGAWAGCGTLRVLRLKIEDDRSACLTAGYESYEPL